MECGREFEARHGLNAICSDKCRLDRKNRVRRKDKVRRDCKWCSKEFETTHCKRQFCSGFCKRKYDTKHRQQFVERRKAERRGYKKELPNCCEICGFDRAIEYCHIVEITKGGLTNIDNIIVLCPNHHRLFDRNELTKEEFAGLMKSYNGQKKMTKLAVAGKKRRGK